MTYLTRRFQKMVRRNGGIPKKGSSSRSKGYDLCHKCGKPEYFIKDCPLHKQDQYKHNIDKTTKRNLVLDRKCKRKDVADTVVKQALAAWGDSSSESEGDDEQDESSMMVVESEAAEYVSIFSPMGKSYEDEDNDEVNFLDIERNLKFFSQKKLVSLANVLIDAYHNLINDKNGLTMELREVEHERDNLVVVVVDLKETIEYLKKENDALTEKIKNVEHERDALLVVVVDLKVTVEELKRESSSGNTLKGKEVASEAHLKLKNEHKIVKLSLCAELERNRQLKEDLGRGAVKGSSQRWYMDSGCSKRMTGSTDDFLSLKALQGGSVSFGNGKKGYILGVGRVGKTPTHSIENVYYVNGLKYNLLSVCQMLDKGNKVEFLSKTCTITNLVTGEVVLMAKRFKNIYVADFESLNSGDLTCLSVVDDDAELWHRRFEHASFSLLNKLVKKDLVRGCLSQGSRITRTKDETFRVFAAFVKQIQVKMNHNVVSIRSDHGTEFDNA
ncbi:uncharacterized protein [Nicotiana tomentosiformis]|uniref:uncharacterized protein n=1 Tax=Nicotiana tomentosiformis TaxID=4098 RepID=UPI00388CB8B9